MLIPCRRCTDEKGTEHRKPLRSFLITSHTQEFWDKVLVHGQDLCCMKCNQAMQIATQDVIIKCDDCDKMKPKKLFNEKYQVIWREGTSERVLCKACEGNHEKTLREDIELIYCHGPLCERLAPDIHFEEQKLAEWRIKGLMHEARCARCVVHDMPESETKNQVKCQRCEVKKRLPDFPAVALKGWLTKTFRHEFRWRCFECQFPRCCGSCAERPLHPVPHNAVHGDRYFCDTCKYPKCEGGCGAERPHNGRYHITNLEKWTCIKCREKCTRSKQVITCSLCGTNDAEAFTSSAWNNRTSATQNIRCRDCGHPPCSALGCTTCDKCRNIKCQRVRCTLKPEPLNAQLLPKTMEAVRNFKCALCAKLPLCKKCGRTLGRGKFSKQDLSNFQQEKTASLSCTDCK